MAEQFVRFLAQAGPGVTLAAGAALAALGVAVIAAFAAWVGMSRQNRETAWTAHAKSVESELAELKGRVAQMTDITAARQADLASAMNERLDRVGQYLGSSLEESGRRTSANLAQLNERLAVIDTAQRTITELSSRVVSLQDILGDKQARGAFGQMRMETIIEDGLPKGAYAFQAALSNGNRPDCVIRLPHTAAAIVIDAKFPLESFEALRKAADHAAQLAAARQVRTDVGRHIDAIVSKYFVRGETQETAMLFVPSERIYATLHEEYPDIIQKAYRAHVVIVSPNILMLAIQTVTSILKDVRMREQAGAIQREVGSMMDDVRRLNERMADVQKHYAQLGPSIDKVLTSSEKIASRGRRVENLDFESLPAAFDFGAPHAAG